MLEIKTYQSGTSIEITLEGSPEEVETKVKQLFGQYPAFGYQTRVMKTQELENGNVRTLVHRYSHCD